MTELADNMRAQLFEMAPDALVAVDDAGAIVLVNVQAERLFGYRREDLVGRPVELILPDARISATEGVGGCFPGAKGGPPIAGEQVAARRSDGGHFPAEVSVAASDSDPGRLISMAIRDATERAKTETEREGVEAEAERERLKAEGEKSEAERVRVEAERVRLDAERELIRADSEKAEAERVRLEAERELVRAEGARTEAERVRLKAESVRLEAENVRLEKEAERERLEIQLHQSQRMESLGQLAGGVAHDFNNLLAVILNYAAFVAEELTKAAGAPTGAHWVQPLKDVEQIQSAAERASLLTHQLLASARREVVQPRVLSLNQAIIRMEQILRRTIGEHIELVIDLAADLPRVIADPGQIEQIVLNLAINARDAMPDGGRLSIDTAAVQITEDVGTDGGATRSGLHICFRVQDTGVGMSPEVSDRAFEPFFTTKPKGEGSGLGLATVYGIVSKAGGRATIHSEEGVGTTVTVLFPAVQQDAAASDAEEEPRRNSSLRGTETILVVEDEDAIREVTRRILTRNGYNVLPAAGGGQAIDIASAHEGAIDLVLTDVNMPNMQGMAVADEMSRRRPGIRVLFMSAFAQSVLGAEFTSATNFGLVEKPFKEATLLAKVREALDGDR